MSRRNSRETVVKIIFQNIFTDCRLTVANENDETDSFFDKIESSEMMDTYFESITEEEREHLDPIYIKGIIDGVVNEVVKLDKYIIKYSKDWTIDRMSKIDLAILRVAIYEIIYRSDIPSSVSINEAVELAKKYSHQDAGSFINGILGSVYSESNS